MFEHTAINPELVQSIDQVYLLRQIATQFFVDQRIQQLTVQTEIERARLSVALVDVLKRAEKIEKVLVISSLSKVLEQIHKSFSLHTVYKTKFLLNSIDENSEVNFIQYQKIFDLIGYDNKKVGEFLNQFDLIITDHIDDEKNEIFRRKIIWYSNWLLNIQMPVSESIALA